MRVQGPMDVDEFKLAEAGHRAHLCLARLEQSPGTCALWAVSLRAPAALLAP
jgi:hypothetical protein